ncbi:unnamed protein product [Musa hybrid cultivar]
MAADAPAKFRSSDLLPAAGDLGVVQHDGLRFWQFMVAGSVAGLVEHTAMFPVDTLKTRMQAGSPPCQPLVGLRQTLRAVVSAEGPLGLYRGVGAMGLGAGPAHAVYFSVYELSKESLSRENPNNPAVHAASGVLATIASDAVFTPMDTVKQRLQLKGSPYKGVVDCVSRVLTEEGIRAFYASYKTTVIMNAPYTAVHFATYEAAKRALMEISPESATDERLVVHATAGAAAGALAAAVTTPLDVVKTQLQCQVKLGRLRSILMVVDQFSKYATFIVAPIYYSAEEATKLIMKNSNHSPEWAKLPQNGLHFVCLGFIGFLLFKVLVGSFVFLEQGVCGCDRFSSSSTSEVIRAIIGRDGYVGLMRGWKPRMLFHAPAAAICWSTYEATKSFFQKRNDQK